MLRTPLSRLAAIALATAGLAAATPAVAGAQPLQSVALRTSISGGYLVLDVKGGSTAPGAEVIQWYGNFSGNQRFNFVPTSDGNQLIVNQKSGLCLATSTVAGRPIFQWYCNANDPQEQWHGDLRYALGSGLLGGDALKNPATGFVMDVEGSSSWAGARVIGWPSNSQQNQHFSYWQLP